jgi:hypothetical protein
MGMATVSATPAPDYRELTFEQWIVEFCDGSERWKQGEHIVILGPTGTGKTYIARDILAARDYVIVIAIKRNDDTLTTFTRELGYYREKKWPPRYAHNKVIYWYKPDDLSPEAVMKQREDVYTILNHAYHDGGWAVLCDDTGYISTQLKLGGQLAVLFSQARSSGISVVAVLVQPSSIAARVPTETLRQVRHYLMFRYKNRKDIRLLSEITGIDYGILEEMMKMLGSHDFIYVHDGQPVIVRNQRGT